MKKIWKIILNKRLGNWVYIYNGLKVNSGILKFSFVLIIHAGQEQGYGGKPKQKKKEQQVAINRQYFK